MHNLRLSLFFLLGSFLCPTNIFAQAQPVIPSATSPSAVNSPPEAAKIPAATTPEEFFARARQLSDLTAAGVPFHLKATYVASGDTEFTGSGTYEEWWKSKDDWRKEATLGDYKYVFVRNGDHEAAFATRPYIPLRLRQAMGYTLVGISENEGLSGGWTLAKTKVGSQTLNIAENNKTPCFSKNKGYPLCDLRYEFTDDGVLRVRHYNLTTTVFNALQRFNSQLIPREILVAIDNKLLLTIHVTMLEQLSPADRSRFDTKLKPANLIALPVIPINPESLKHAKIQRTKCKSCPSPVGPMAVGTVRTESTGMVNLSIDETGRVREPFVLISAGSLLDKIALQAVSQWRYSPLKIDGAPVMSVMSIPEKFQLLQ